MIRKILLSLIVLEVIAMSLSATEKQTRKAVEEKIELLGSSLSEEEYLELLTKYKVETRVKRLLHLGYLFFFIL